MLKENNKAAWVGVMFTVITYSVIITVYAVTTRSMAEGNRENIKKTNEIHSEDIKKTNEIHRQDFREIQQQWIQSTEKLYQELKEIRKEINK